MTPQPLCHLLARLSLQHRGWGSMAPLLVWLFSGILSPGLDPPRWSPSSSLWADPGGLKELMPKSTQFPNIPVG